MRNNKAASLFPKELVIESLKQSFVKLNPRVMFRNPIMFIVEVVTFVMLFVTIWAVATGDTTQGSFGYNMLVFIVLFATLLFANFAEAIAEARGKAQADSLRKTREETPARLCVGNKIETEIARWTSCRSGPRPDRRRTGLPSTGILSTTRKWC